MNPSAAAGIRRRPPDSEPANLISLARLLSVPLEVYLILHSEYALAFWLFVLAGVSDCGRRAGSPRG